MDIFVLENKQNNISGSSSTTTNIITAIIIMMEEISPSLQKMSFRRWKPELRKKIRRKNFATSGQSSFLSTPLKAAVWYEIIFDTS